MILRKIELRSFRQFVDVDVTLGEGITAITGPNGSGKTTLVEAIKYALYGIDHCRGKMEELPNMHHGGKMSVAVEFDLGVTRYRCERSKNDASLRKQSDDGWERIAFSLSGVKNYNTSLLGLTADQFCSSYFTEQKEIEFLKFAKSKQQQEIAQMLGIEVLASAEKLSKERGKAAEVALMQTESMLGSKEALTTDIESKRTSHESQLKALADTKKELASMEARVATLKPQSAKADEWFELLARTKNREDVGRRLQAELKQIESEVAVIEILVKERSELEPLATRFAEVREKHSEMSRLRGALEERELWMHSRDEKCAELEKLVAVSDTAALDRVATTERQVAAMVKSREEWVSKVDCLHKEWQEKKSQAANLISLLKRDRDAFSEELRAVAEAESKGICPTCGQALPDGHAPKSDDLRTSISKLGADLVAAEENRQALESDPLPLVDARQELSTSELKCERLKVALDQARIAADRQSVNEERAVSIRKQLADLQAKIDKAPTTFDKAAFDLVCEEIAALEPKQIRYHVLEHAPNRLQSAVKNRDEKSNQFETEKAGQAADKKRMSELGLNEASAGGIRNEYAAACASLPHLRRRIDDGAAAVEVAASAVKEAEQRLEDWHENSKKIESHRHDRDLYREVGDAFNELRVKLNLQIRPTLATFAAEALSQITDNRYIRVAIDESFNATLLDGESKKNVISGGEEDMLALSLRIALSRYIQEKSGLPLSLLVLDEVFGSLDADRRMNVLEMFDGLRGMFPQILLISHVEGLTERADRVLRVNYDQLKRLGTVEDVAADLSAAV